MTISSAHRYSSTPESPSARSTHEHDATLSTDRLLSSVALWFSRLIMDRPYDLLYRSNSTDLLVAVFASRARIAH